MRHLKTLCSLLQSTIRDLRHRIVHGEDETFEPADAEPTAWGTAWEQQMNEAEAAQADDAEDDNPATGSNDWRAGSGAAEGTSGGACMVSGRCIWGQEINCWHPYS